jgi:protein involved in sex pheromone biosynthesis
MKKIIHIVLLSSILILSACDNNPFLSKDEGLNDLNKVIQRWIDGDKLATNTSRGHMLNSIQNLQSIKNELQDIKISKCLIPAKKALIVYMNTKIDGYFDFSNNGQSYPTKFKQAEIDLDAYITAASICK